MKAFIKIPQVWLVLLPALYVVLVFGGPWITDPLAIYGGGLAQVSGAFLPGYATIDPNIASTSYALGVLALHDLAHFTLPLWDHYEGLGQPLLGGLISAALFPPTLLLAFPGGQTIEHAVLQAIGGLGMYYLGRELSFRPRTTFAIAVVFEFCALFVWLKNAMVNPVPFLVWVLVFTHRLIRDDPDRRWIADALGLGIAAGFAVSGGFPETVLIFTGFLFVWVAFYIPWRAAGWRSLAALSGKFLLALGVSLCIAGAVLVGFLAFVPEANFGPHADTTNSMRHLSLFAALKYLFPYLSGPIFGYTVPDEIGSIGGYTGTVLPLLAIIGLLSPSRLAERIFWFATIALCLAVSHGFEPVQRRIMSIPGFGLTAFYRQANLVWLIALLLLAAHALEQASSLSRRRIAVAMAIMGLIVAQLIYINTAKIIILLTEIQVARWFVVSVAAGCFLFVAAGTAMLLEQRRIAVGLLIAESAAAFLLPVLSLPREKNIDRQLVRFLKSTVGLHRTVNFSSNVIAPDFGSYLSVSQLNFDSNPVPLSTTQFIHDHLDPMFPSTSPLYLMGFPPDATTKGRLEYMRRRIAEYGKIGVKYVLAEPGTFGFHNPAVVGTNVPHQLYAGERLEFEVKLPASDGGAAALGGELGLRLATYGRTSQGYIEAKTCRPDGRCETRRGDSNSIIDNGVFMIASDVHVADGQVLRVSINKVGGGVPFVAWLYDEGTATAELLQTSKMRTSAGRNPGKVPDVRFAVVRTPDVTRVLQSASADVYEINAVQPYMSAQGCKVEATSFDRATVDCQRPSLLTRLEIWMSGWYAQVDGKQQPVSNGLPFQQLAVPVGRHSVEFIYDPYQLRALSLVSIASSVGFPALFLYLTLTRFRTRARTRVRTTRLPV